MKNILIAPWGDPEGWKEVRYKYKDIEINSKTSLKIIQDIEKPDKTIIIVLDTLADGSEKYNNYNEIKKDVEFKIKEFAYKSNLYNSEIIVAPGTGTFKNGIFEGKPTDFYYYILWELVLKLIDNYDEEITIHLDLTHGINYTTILTYRAIKEILKIYSIFTKKLNFKAYNTDPSFPFGISTLKVNLIENVNIKEETFNEKININQRLPLKALDLTSEERRELNQKYIKWLNKNNININLINKNLSSFIGALYNGLPMAIFRFFPDRKILKKIIIYILNLYERYFIIKIKKDSNKLKIIKRLSIENNFKIYIFVFLVSTLLEKMNILVKQKNIVSIEEIEKIVEELFYFDERIKIKIQDDIYNLRNDLEEKDIKEWKIYNDILCRKIGNPDERNFLAHSGLERNVVEIKEGYFTFILNNNRFILDENIMNKNINAYTKININNKNKKYKSLFLRYDGENIDIIARYCCSGLN